MARRRSRKRKKDDALGGLFLALIAFGLAFAGLSALVDTARAHPAASVLVLVLVAAVAVAAGTLWWRARTRRLALEAARAREIAVYHRMTPRQFEEALAYLCRRDGCSGVKVVGGAGDLGADVIATTPHGRRLVIQAKRYRTTSKVSGPDLQKFGGTCYAVHQAAVAAVVTTSSFTAQARDYAAHMNIRLYGNDSLAAWASQTGPPPWD